jgi:hypothetical protein
VVFFKEPKERKRDLFCSNRRRAKITIAVTGAVALVVVIVITNSHCAIVRVYKHASITE